MFNFYFLKRGSHVSQSRWGSIISSSDFSPWFFICPKLYYFPITNIVLTVYYGTTSCCFFTSTCVWYTIYKLQTRKAKNVKRCKMVFEKIDLGPLSFICQLVWSSCLLSILCQPCMDFSYHASFIQMRPSIS